MRCTFVLPQPTETKVTERRLPHHLTARSTRPAAIRMPLEPMSAVAKERRVAALVPALVLAAAAAVGFALMRAPSPLPPPLAGTTTTVTTAPQTTTTNAVTATTVEAGVVIGPGIEWIRSTYPSGIVLSDGTTIPEPAIAYFSLKSVAWDGADGVAYLADGGDEKWQLRWARPGSDSLVAELEWFTHALADVVRIDDTPYAILFLPGFNGEDPGFRWIDLITGADVPPIDGYVRTAGFYAVSTGAQGRWVHLEEPDWSDIERGEIGEPIPPFPLPLVIITDDNGAELLRFEIGDFERPYVTLHDFDGRRVIVSKEPFEPAAAPRTVYLVDLECPGCTTVIDAGPDSFDLVGVSRSVGPVGLPLIP